MGFFGFLGSIASLADKLMPGRKEAAIQELQDLENALGAALRINDARGAAIIRKRMKQIREKYPDIQ